MEPKKIGIVVMFKLNVGGGAQRVVVDLIKSLNEFGHEVHLLTPWKLDHKKIAEIFEPVELAREYNLHGSLHKLCVEPKVSRKLMKGKFQEMVNNVDLVMDLDGGVLHRYVPIDKKYLIWRISGIVPNRSSFENDSWKIIVKNLIKKIAKGKNDDLSLDHNVYAVDDWTKKAVIVHTDCKASEICLYPEIKTEHFKFNKKGKKNQMLVLGRISPHRRIDEAIKIFARATLEKDYNLVVLGGVTPDSENYIGHLKVVAEEEGVGDKVSFLRNPSFEKLKETVEESKVCIECLRDISLTMTSIECLAAGVIVLAHRNGGTFREVLDNGRYGLGFNDTSEGIEKLKKIVNKLDEGKTISKKLKDRALFFSGDKFRERLDTILVENGI